MSIKKITTKVVTKSSQETQQFAVTLAQEILGRSSGKTALVLALQGDLGAGKTTFVQGFAEGLGIQEKILSPTFIVMRSFKVKNENFQNFYHIDCYRLTNEKDLEMLDFKRILSNPANIIAVEWPERVKKLLPTERIKISFKSKKENVRVLTIGE